MELFYNLLTGTVLIGGGVLFLLLGVIEYINHRQHNEWLRRNSGRMFDIED